MRKIHYGFIIGGVCIVALLSGIASGFMKNSARQKDFVNIKSVAAEEETALYHDKEHDYYELIIDGNYLYMHEVFSDNSKRNIEKAEINIAVLPQSEVEALKKGVKFEEKEEALMIMECFVS